MYVVNIFLFQELLLVGEDLPQEGLVHLVLWWHVILKTIEEDQRKECRHLLLVEVLVEVLLRP